MALQAQKCHFPTSSWVHAFILTCDNKLAVWYKRHVRHVHHHAGGGVPGVCCLYPGSSKALYDLAVVWWSPGHFVHRFLYKIMAYVIVAPPKMPCGGDCGGGVQTVCCASPLPNTLYATFTGGVSLTVPMDINVAQTTWVSRGNTFGSCMPSNVLFYCNPADGTFWLVVPGAAGGNDNYNPPTSLNCGPPFAATFTGVDASLCLGAGAGNLAVTVTP
jgi:hypothetical protein